VSQKFLIPNEEVKEKKRNKTRMKMMMMIIIIIIIIIKKSQTLYLFGGNLTTFEYSKVQKFLSTQNSLPLFHLILRKVTSAI
jgi:hypothetical protein